MKHPVIKYTTMLFVLWFAAPLAVMAETEGKAPPDTTESRARALRDGWPDTPVGMVASGWVDAFAAGEDPMREFLEGHVAKADLAERSMTERMTSYKKLRKRFGDLMLNSVVESEAAELTVMLLAEDASQHRFVFEVGEEPPHKLVMVGILQAHGHGGHSGREQ